MAVCGVEFRILGPVEVRVDGGELQVGGPRQRALLAFLLLSANRVVSRDRLIAELVPEQSGEAAARALTVQVSRLRKALSSIDSPEPRLVARAPGYVLHVEPGELDLHTFERLVAEGRQALEGGDPDRAVAVLREAESLWRGHPLADLEFEPFARLEVERLEELRLAAVEERIEVELELGQHAALVPELETLAAKHPLRERLRGQLMLALYRSGRQADALRVYRETRRQLVEELGIEPGQALRELESGILRQDDTLESPAARPGSHTLAVVGDRGPRPPKPADAPAVSPPRPRSRRPLLTGAAALIVAAGTLGGALAADLGSSRSRPAAPNTIVVIDPRTNALSATTAVGARPGALVAGSGGVWVANLDDRTITRIDPRTRKVVRTIPVAVEVAGLADGAGSVWYTTSKGRLSRIEPAYDSTAPVASLGAHGGRFARPVRPAAVGFGSVWVVDASGLVARVSPATGKVIAKVQVGTNATAIAAGEGAVWVASPLDDTVSQIDPTNAVTTIPVGHGPTGLAVGAGAVWVTDRYDDTVQRIDPKTGSVVTTIPVGSSPEAIAVAAGAVWVANSHDGTVTRIDPATNKVVHVIAVDGTPTAIAAVKGKPWVAVAASALPFGAKPAAGVARFTLETDLSSPDPALAFDFASWQIERSTCALLASYPERQGPDALVASPELARSVSRSADGKTWTFELRRGVRFSPPSREEMSALTVKRSFERALDPRMRGAASYVLPSIAGEPAFLAGKARHVSGIVADGERLTIRLTAPTPDLLARLAVPFFCIVPSNTPVDPNGIPSIPSAGPYYVASYVPDQELVLRRNPNYRGQRPRHLAEIVYAIGIGKAKGEAMVQHGQSDYAVDGPPAADQQRLLAHATASSNARSRVRFLAYPSLTVRYLALNTRRPLFAHARLRRAVSYAIDRNELASVLRRTFSKWENAGGEPTDSYLPPGVPGGPGGQLYPFHADPRAARRLTGNVHATAVLYTCDTAPCPQVAAVLSTDLGRIGIRLRIKTFPLGVLYQKATLPNAPYDILAYGWAPDWLDPANVLGPFLDASAIGTPNNANFANFVDRRYAVRFAAASRLYPPERYRAFARLVRELERRASPLVAYSVDASYNLFSSRLGCQLYQPLYGVDLGALCVNS
jgi:YVTN family beta-propeller protein